MEITYKSGAKVILQGPCTYEVDSRRRLPLAGQADGTSGNNGGRRKGEGGRTRIRRQKSPFPPSSFLLRRSHSHRHRHRPGYGVRRRSGQVGRQRGRTSSVARSSSGQRRRRRQPAATCPCSKVNESATGERPAKVAGSRRRLSPMRSRAIRARSSGDMPRLGADRSCSTRAWG